jgi:hypothetical protein
MKNSGNIGMLRPYVRFPALLLVGQVALLFEHFINPT